MPWSALSWYYQGMGYDNLNRLTSIADSSGTVSNYSRTFQYDEYGNMSLATTPGVPLSGLTPMASTGAYNAANNRLNSAGYDTRGNMTHLGAAWMAYDAESRQTQTVDSGQTLIYLYDAAGQRVQKQIAGGATTVYVHDAFGNLAAEYNSAGVTPACVTCYLSYDHLGSVRLVTDQNANVVARHDFLPFGEEIPNGYAGRNGNGFGATGNVAQMFTGQERDGGTAVWDYFNARHMSAVLGSFMQADPGNAGGDVMHPQSWNGYAYVLGNPLGMVDPSGMDPIQTNCPDCTVTVFSGSLDDITTYNYSWFYGRWGSTNSSSGGGGSVFSTTVYGKANVPTASTAPAKTGTPAPKTLSCQINSRAANIPGGQLLHSLGINHEWITTSTGKSAGMGTAQGVPQSDYPGVQTQVVDHTGQVPNSSRTFSNVDAAALNTYIKAGAPTGPWIPGVNDCNTWANGAVNSSTPHNITVVMYGVPVTIATGVVVYSDGSIHAPGGY